MRSFRALVINSTCVSLSWSLLDNGSVPLFMVVQWSPQKQQDPDHHKGLSGETWARVPYTERIVYLRGNMFSVFHFISVSVNRVLKEQVVSANLIFNLTMISGDFFGSEEYGFYLYPVFAEGEGETVYTIGMHWFSGCCNSILNIKACARIAQCQRLHCTIIQRSDVHFPPVTATRGDPAAYMMLIIISFLSIVLFVTLVLSQNQ